jgi:peptidoglycan/LPS O-acetylase OafA/YrhL
VVKGFWMSFSINCMAFGGLFAILLFQKSRLLIYLQHHILFYISMILLGFLMFKIIYVTYFQQELYAVLFSIIILNFATNNAIKISLENKYFNYLGSISYGLYMYHPIAIVLVLGICTIINFTSNWLIYPLSFILTVFIAGFSYKYFESFFLKFKNQF